MLMRNDIAFIGAAYGAMWLGAYAVPVNWHFKPEEIDFDVLRDLVIGKRGLACLRREDEVNRFFLDLALRLKNCDSWDCRAVSGAISHVLPDRAFRRRPPAQSRRRSLGA
jgi:hypothetical protein